MFTEKLLEIADTYRARQLIAEIPGVYELVAEHLNNEVIEALEEERDAG